MKSSDNQTPLLWICIGVYIVFSCWATLQIVRSTHIASTQKKVHTFLIWCIPFCWYFIARHIWTAPKNTVMTKTKRNALLKKQASFKENGKGRWYS